MRMRAIPVGQGVDHAGHRTGHLAVVAYSRKARGGRQRNRPWNA